MQITSLAILLAFSTFLANKAPLDSKIKTSEEKEESHVNTLYLFGGLKKTSENTEVKLKIDMNFDQVLMGNREKLGWGLKCKEEVEDQSTSCQYEKVGLSIINRILQL